MHRISKRRPLVAVLALLVAGALALVARTGLAGAVAVPTGPVTGNATHFDALGSPYGGCGLPQAQLETQNFVALNVFNTPRDYGAYPRPIPASMADKIGLWDNGRNCGRWVQVTIGDFCTGVNDGAPGQAFCRNGSWVADAYNGATLTMLVADSCGDANAWCRDDPYHLDLATDSINRFLRNGVPVGDLNPAHWNNRHIQWQFVAAPNYTGDIQIGFLQGAQRWWPAIALSRLPNGIHGVEYYANGAWTSAQMNSDMGQSYVIGATTAGGTDFRIRVRDVADALIGNGRMYRFTLPAACATQCGAPYTRVDYTVETGTDPSPSTSASASPSASPSTSASASPSASPSSNPGGCSVSVTVTGSWGDGYQADVTVQNTGRTALAGWQVGFGFQGTQQVASFWNAVVTQSGNRITARNESYNGTVAAGASVHWGMVVRGQAQPVTQPTCTGS